MLRAPRCWFVFGSLALIAACHAPLDHDVPSEAAPQRSLVRGTPGPFFAALEDDEVYRGLMQARRAARERELSSFPVPSPRNVCTNQGALDERVRRAALPVLRFH